MCYNWWHHNPISPFTTRRTPGDLMSAYMIILSLKILFVLIKNDSNIKGIESFEYCYLYITYGDDTKFFLKYENSIVHLFEKFALFSDSLGLKPNTTNCKIAGTGVLKRSKR